MLYDPNGQQIPIESIEINAPVDNATIEQIIQLFKGGLLVFKQCGRTEPFFVRDIIGGVNHEWIGIAPIELYNAYSETLPHEEAFKQAGLAAGRIFKATLIQHADQYQLLAYVDGNDGKRRAQYRAIG